MSDLESRGSLREGALVGGRFKVERLIGRGGMGEVYAARHATTGKEVALKLILADSGSCGEHVRRFMREARAATAIQHPNVIEVFDVFEDSDGTPVMVMELLKGEPFSTYRERVGALRLHEVAEILLPATRALQAAHEKGIVHRDLKPDNVFLATTATGQTTKLLDFGIAKILDPTKIGSETQGQPTNTGSILGTPHYMSYEQAMSDKLVDHRTDIWAMGVMIFEALTGRRPLTFETLGQMYTSFIQGTVPSIREFLPELPDDVATVLDHCLVKNQEERLGELRPLVDMLAKYADAGVPGARVGGHVLSLPVKSSSAARSTGSPLASSVGGESIPRRPRALLVAAAVIIVGGGIGLGTLAFSRGTQTTAVAPTGQPPPEVVSAPSAATSAPAPENASGAPPAASAVVASVPSSTTYGAPPRAARFSNPRPVKPAPAPAASPASSEIAPPKKGISDKLPY